MCAGFVLANKELYLAFMRMLSFFEIVGPGDVDVYPVTGSCDPASLVIMPHRYRVYFRPQNEELLREFIEEKEAANVFG